MKEPNDQRMIKWLMLPLLALTALGVNQFSELIEAEGWVQLSVKLQAARIGGWVLAVLLLGFTILAWLGKIEKLASGFEELRDKASKIGWLAALLALVSLALYPLLVLGKMGVYFPNPWARLALFGWILILVAGMIAVWRGESWSLSLAPAALGMGMAYMFATFIPHVSASPFGLWWSETSRFYLASTFFDERIYGVDAPWVFRDTTRYLLQAIPFLFEGTPLWVHRLWQALMRFTFPYITGLILARRLKLKWSWETALLVIWTGLYIFQGPVFFNLLVIVMVTIGLTKTGRFWKTLIVVGLISIWAGLSRVNWVPMSGLIATLIYVLERPMKGKGFKGWLSYIWQPIVWVLAGGLMGFLAQRWYAANSGHVSGVASTSFTSDLLWKRLFPNPSYELGIVIAILLVSLPLLVYCVLALRGWKQRWHWLRLVVVIGIVGVLFVGGLVVSVKIGGGTNLHNMDVYLVALLIVAVWLYFGKAVDEEGEVVHVETKPWLMGLIVAAPVVFAATFGGRTIQPMGQTVAMEEVEAIQAYVDAATEEGGEVLFVTQRHLITFDYIEGVDLVWEYEKMELMDNTMAGNETFLGAFEGDLAAQRFSLIVHDPLPTVWKNPEKKSLAAENNVYLKRAVPLMLCAYEEETRLVDGTVQILVPKDVVECE